MKKILTYVLLLAIITLGCINFVKAEEVHLTMEQVVEKLNEYLKNATELGLDNLSVKIEDNKLVFMEGEEKGLEFKIEGDVISDTLTVENTDDDSADLEIVGNALIRSLLYSDIVNVVATLHGYSERDIRTFSAINNEEINPEMTKDGYEIKTDSQETKTTLTFKIDINKFNLKLDYLDKPKPTLDITNITKNSVEIYASVDLDEEDVLIELYRSTDNENFEWIGSIPNSTEASSLGLMDENLEPNTIYYYKAVVEKSKNYSDFVKITTLSEEVNDANETEENKQPVIPEDADKPTDNKQTGGLSVIGLSLLIPVSLLGINFLNKKQLIRNDL